MLHANNVLVDWFGALTRLIGPFLLAQGVFQPRPSVVRSLPLVVCIMRVVVCSVCACHAHFHCRSLIGRLLSWLCACEIAGLSVCVFYQLFFSLIRCGFAEFHLLLMQVVLENRYHKQVNLVIDFAALQAHPLSVFASLLHTEQLTQNLQTWIESNTIALELPTQTQYCSCTNPVITAVGICSAQLRLQ